MTSLAAHQRRMQEAAAAVFGADHDPSEHFANDALEGFIYGLAIGRGLMDADDPAAALVLAFEDYLTAMHDDFVRTATTSSRKGNRG